VESIRASGEHLLGILNDILDLSKLEAGRMELRNGAFSLTATLRSVAAMFRARGVEKGLAFVLDESIGVRHVYGDEGKLRQVLVNLVGNAIKFTDAGHVTLAVRAAAENRYEFEVRDTGPGISPEHHTIVFEPFLQVGDGGCRGGTGLGLSIARQHVRLMGGTLRLDSVPGHGARFYFSIELPPADAPAESGGTREAASTGSSILEAQADAEIERQIFLSIDAPLYDRLVAATDFCSVTDLRRGLEQLGRAGPQGAALAQLIGMRLRRCDFPGIRRVLADHAPVSAESQPQEA
jgi:hypothetical protein